MKKLIKIGSDCSGVGALIQSLNRLNINHTEVFACDFDYYARLTYLYNYGTKDDIELGNSSEHKRHADNVKAIILGTLVSNRESEILKEANDFAKKFSFYFPFNMYQRDVPETSLDLYVSSVPCQAFSLAGKRKGEDDKRGVLFYNSHEFIKKNKPRYFIFENVKGLLSDDGGKTFQRWIDYLGGKSVNGNPVIFPLGESVPYHVYYKVLNAKDYGVPQNRERVFIIGIRDDADNNFAWPKPICLEKRLKDVLETNVDEKYYLSDKMIEGFIGLNPNGVARTIRCGGGGSKDDKHNWDLLKVGYINQDTQASQVFSQESVSQTLCAGTHGYANGYVEVKSATSKGYETAKIGEDSINFEHPNSKTRRGRVGVGVGQTLTTNCNQGVAFFEHPKVKFQLTGGKWDKTHEQSGRVYDENGISPTIHTMQGGGQEPKVAIGAIRGRNPDNPKSRESGLPTQQMLEINEKGTSNALTTVQKDNVVIENWIRGGLQQNQPIQTNGVSPCLTSAMGMGGGQTPIHNYDYRIRKLTPRECFRLMNFPDTFKFVCSDSQLYKQAGNSIVVAVLASIIGKLNIK